MSTGLVLEGGAMRGMYTSGILDVFMENDIYFKGMVGVSAGAAFGCSYKSKQLGRSLRYSKDYCRDKNYISFKSWITTGDLYNVDFAYNKIPNELDIFDNDTFENNPMEFYAVCTDALTGESVYHKCDTVRGDNLQWVRASASLPLAARLVDINGRLLSDGGMSDSIPIKFFERMGYEKNVVILTQPLNFVKEPSSMLPVMKIILRKYPALINSIANRHIIYNETLDYIKEQERLGKVFVFRPDEPLNIKKMERDPNTYDRVYNHGRDHALERLDELKKFIENK